MKKRILSLMLGISLIVGILSGCGSEVAEISGSQAETGEEAVEQSGEKEFYLAKKTIHNSDSSITEYEYDEQGNQIKMTVSYESYGNSHDTSLSQYEYDNAGNVLRESTSYTSKWTGGDNKNYNENVSDLTAEYKYDSAGNLLLKNTSYSSNSDYAQNDEGYSYENHSKTDMTEEEEYEYDSSGNLLRKIYTANVESEAYTVNDGESDNPSWDESITQEYTYVYDDVGRKLKETENYTKRTVYKPDGSETSDEHSVWTEYEYDDNGNLVKECKFFDNDPDTPFEWSEYEYDEAGNLLRDSHSSNGINEYTYDAAGNQLTATYYYDGSERSRTECEYDEAGNKKKSRVFYLDYSTERLYLAGETEYDTAGNVLKDVNYYGTEEASYMDVEAGGISYWEEYTYDEDGNKTADITYDADGNIINQIAYTVEEELDEEGRLIKSTRYENEDVISWTEYEYKQK